MATGSGADEAVPLTLLTGFLGAGKTTLVNRVLTGGLGGPVGVLVNDFGTLDIDRALIADESAGVLSLSNGCICCSLRGDLVAAAMRVLQRPEGPRRVLLEASGVADPAPIVATFLAPAFRRRLRLDSVICVVDAEQALTDPALAPLQLRQIGCSDLVVLNKADLAGLARVDQVAARIRREFSGARLLPAVRCELPSEVLFSRDPDDIAAPAASAFDARDTGGSPHAPGFESCSFEEDAKFCADALHDLARRLPPSVYRVKGIVRIAGRGGRPDRRGVLQVVGRRADLTMDRDWTPGDGPSRLVFIGMAGRLENGRLAEFVRNCAHPVS